MLEGKVDELAGLVAALRTEFEKFQSGKVNDADFKTFREKIEKDIDIVQTKLSRPPLEPQHVQKGDGPSAEMKSFAKANRFGFHALNAEEQKVLQIGDATLGGYLAPGEYVREMLRDVVVYSPLRTVARVRQTSADYVEIPKRTGNSTAVWVSELGTRSETTGLKFGLEKLEPFEMYSLYKFTKKSIEDAAFNLEEEARLDAAEQQGKLEGTAFISGTGAGQPEGVISNTAVLAAKIAGNNSGALGVNDILDTYYGLPAAYAQNGTWLMSRSSERACMALVDGTGHYVWATNLVPGQPTTLLGRPILSCTDMPTITANAYSVAFGDFRAGYLIVDRIQVEVQRLLELYAEAGQIGLMIRRRVTGQVVMPNAIRVLQIKA